MRDSWGSSGTGETPKCVKHQGGSPHAPRKASICNGYQPLSMQLELAKNALKSQVALLLIVLCYNYYRNLR
jgi:hypothetical protein